MLDKKMLTRLNWPTRILLLVAGFGLIKPGIYTDIFGAAVLTSIYLWQRKSIPAPAPLAEA